LADDFAPGIQASRNQVVGQAFGGQEDDFGTEDLKVRQRIFGRSMSEHLLLILSESDREWAFSWHIICTFLCRDNMPERHRYGQLQYVSVFKKLSTKPEIEAAPMPEEP
jgi:hypothetical protein